ncbi:polymer-forming cytoskeletal protein [bacterium]|nr:polymer-forming cytoskeletal protein [bacterium]
MFNGKKEADKIDDKIETIIGVDTNIKGTLASKSSIRIDGTIEGDVISHKGGVVLGEKGLIKGNIKAQTVTIGGKIIGNIHVVHNIDIQVKAHVHGDIYAQQLVISEGALFEGNCTMSKEKEIPKTTTNITKSNIVELDVNSKKN